MNAIQKSETRKLSKAIQEQVDLWNSPRFKGKLSPALIFTHKLVCVGRDRYQLVQRKTPIERFDFDLHGNAGVVSGMSRTITESIGIDHRSKAKYAEDRRVLSALCDGCSLEIGELQAASGAGNGY